MHVLDSPMELLDAFVAAASIFLSSLLHMNSSALKTEQRQFGSKEGINAMLWPAMSNMSEQTHKWSYIYITCPYMSQWNGRMKLVVKMDSRNCEITCKIVWQSSDDCRARNIDVTPLYVKYTGRKPRLCWPKYNCDF